MLSSAHRFRDLRVQTAELDIFVTGAIMLSCKKEVMSHAPMRIADASSALRKLNYHLARPPSPKVFFLLT